MDCLGQIYIQKGYEGAGNMFVDCGKCEPCRKKRATEWALRLRTENKHAANAFFITLTYNNESIPMTFDNETGELLSYDLRKKDLQNWVKRMRSRKERIKQRDFTPTEAMFKDTRYFGIGEYGGIFGRPHYHILFFNYPGEFIFKHTEGAWAKGRVHIGEVTDKSIMYVANYCMKDENFLIVSKGYTKKDKDGNVIKKVGAIGYQYSEDMGSWHKDRDQYYIEVTTHKGDKAKYGMPRYWRKTVEAEYKEGRREEALAEKDLQYWKDVSRLVKKYGDRAEEELIRRRIAKAARANKKVSKIQKLD